MKCFLLLALVTLGHCVPDSATRNVLVAVKTEDEQQSGVGDPLICLVCIDVMVEMKESLKSTKLQQDIERAVENGICPLLPDAVKCKAKVTVFGPVFFQMVTSNLDAETLCQDVGLCPASGKVQSTISSITATVKSIVMSALSKFLPQPDKNMDCDMCLMALSWSLRKLTSNKTEEEMIDLANKVCAILPHKYRKECQSLLHNYAPMVIEIIAKELINPWKICSNFHICPNGTESIQGTMFKTDQGVYKMKGQDSAQRYL